MGKEERLINPILCCSLMLFFRGHAKLYSQPRPWQWEIDGRTRIVEADPGENRGWNCGENNREPNPCEAGRCGVELAFFFFFLVPVLLDWERVGGYNHRHWFRRSRSGGSGKCTRWIAQGIESDNYILEMPRMPTQLLDR